MSSSAAAVAESFMPIFGPMIGQDERQLRQALREFRMALRDANQMELREMLRGLSAVEQVASGTMIGALAAVYGDAAEEELEARVSESAWEETKRLARRGTKATRAWLKTEQGKEAAAGLGIIAALLGFNLWG